MQVARHATFVPLLAWRGPRFELVVFLRVKGLRIDKRSPDTLFVYSTHEHILVFDAPLCSHSHLLGLEHGRPITAQGQFRGNTSSQTI